jgi:hypothetical protein
MLNLEDVLLRIMGGNCESDSNVKSKSRIIILQNLTYRVRLVCLAKKLDVFTKKPPRKLLPSLLETNLVLDAFGFV